MISISAPLSLDSFFRLAAVSPQVGLAYAHALASKLLNQSAEVSELMAIFCRGLIPGIPFVVGYALCVCVGYA